MRMDNLRYQKYKSKQLKNNTLDIENNFNPINISINDMDKFKKKKKLAEKKTFTKKIWYDWYYWLINYLSELIEKTVGAVKDQIKHLFKTKDYSRPKRVKIVCGGEKKQSEENINLSIFLYALKINFTI